MITFWASTGTLTVAVLFILLFPLFRRPNQEVGRASYGVHVFSEQLKEVERDVERGLLSTDQEAVARYEIERRLLAAAETGEAAEGPGIGRFPRWAAVTGVALALPAGILSIYLSIGSPHSPDKPLAERTEELKWAAKASQFESMINKLADRLKDNPGDTKGWVMLGRSYNALGRMRESADAYLRAYGLDPENPMIAVNYGEALVYANEGHVSKTAREAFETALKLEPDNLKGRFFLGFAKAQNADELAEAIEIWTGVERDAPPDAPWLAGLQEQLKRAKKNLGKIQRGEKLRDG